MSTILLRDPTAGTRRIYLAAVQIAGGRHVFGVRLEPHAARWLPDYLEVGVAPNGEITVRGTVVGRLVDQAGRPTGPDSRRAWKLLRPDGRPGRLGAALKRALQEGRLTRRQALTFLAWIGCPTPEATLRRLER